jgi:anti-sigma regulatory factor (Ser/Thr protein kinase)
LGSTRAGHPDLIAVDLELMLAPTPVAPARARAALGGWLAEHRSGEALIEVAVLLVSELVTNAVRHAAIAAGDHVRLHARTGDGVLRLEVRDGGTAGTVARRAREREDRIGGYGLELVDRLSSAWGVERDGRGTTVWLELPAGARATA